MSENHHPRLRSGLPDGPANGIAGLADRLMRDEDAQIVCVGILERDGFVHSDSEHVDIPYVRFVAIDEVDAKDAQWIRELLNKNKESRRLAGQLELEVEPTEMSELMAEFHEFADDIGQSVDALKADFSDWDSREHGKKRSPEGTDPQTIRMYLAARRLEDGLPTRDDLGSVDGDDPNPNGEWDDDDVPGRAIDTVELPTDAATVAGQKAKKAAKVGASK